eukprot:m.181384 g.181384  ORF g.181384 m.181384 type:complete len:1048 (+) comp39270_c0_seq3:476-3619(+)
MAAAKQGALEGFICPNCMVKFPSDAGVRAHWIEFHSGLEKTQESDREKEKTREGLTAVGTRAPEPKNPRGIRSHLRHIIAKGRGRYIDNTFDLDLTYITERIIAMSFPASGLESTYRNNLEDVAKMLKQKHQDNYMVFNLSERSYDVSKLNNQVLDFGWPDHLAPPLDRLCSICKSIDSWLASDAQHVVVVHCKGGKGRTGVVISAYMHYSNLCTSAEDALDRFAMKRFYDDKLGGVTQPSQRRYVHYFEDLLTTKIRLTDGPIILQNFIMHGSPNFDGRGGCKLFLKIYQDLNLIHTTEMQPSAGSISRILIPFPDPLELSGDILIKGFHKSLSSRDLVFRCQFHTCAVTEYVLVFNRADLDEAYRDKRFPDTCRVEFVFSPPLVDFKKGETIQRALQRVDKMQMSLKRNSPGDGAEEIEKERAQPEGESTSTKPTTKQEPEHYAGPLDESLYAAVHKLPSTQLKRHPVSTDSRSPSPSTGRPEKKMSQFEMNWHRRVAKAGLASPSPSPSPSPTTPSFQLEADVRMSSNAGRITENVATKNESYYGTVALSPQEKRPLASYVDVHPVFDDQKKVARYDVNSFDGWFRPEGTTPPPPEPSRGTNDWLIQLSPDKTRRHQQVGMSDETGHRAASGDKEEVAGEGFHSSDTLSNVTFELFVPENQEQAKRDGFFKNRWGDADALVAATAAAGKPRPSTIGGRAVVPGSKQQVELKPPPPPRSPASVNMRKQFWYKPFMTKVEADRLLQNSKPGSFVVRDSQSRSGCFSLVMKTTQSYVDPLTKKCGGVKHFLVVLEGRGYKLLGSEEPEFNSLIQFVLEHSITPYQLPCKLVIPMKDMTLSSPPRLSPASSKSRHITTEKKKVELKRPTPVQVTATPSTAAAEHQKASPLTEVLTRGAACEVLYLMTTEVPNPSGSQAITRAVADYVIRAPFITPVLVHFKATIMGILLICPGKKAPVRRHYPVRSVLSCWLDASKTKVLPWVGEPRLGTSKTQRIFGIVTRRPGTTDRYCCHLYAEYDEKQPAEAIVSFVNKIIVVTSAQQAPLTAL